MQQHLLAIKSTKQTGLVFEFFQPHHLWQLMEPPRNIHQWAKGHSSFLRKKKSTIIDVEGMEYNSERPKIVPKKTR